MRDEIFWSNLQGILKRGKWTLSLEEASALLAIYQEAVRRSKPDQLDIIQQSTPQKKKKQSSGGTA